MSDELQETEAKSRKTWASLTTDERLLRDIMRISNGGFEHTDRDAKIAEMLACLVMGDLHLVTYICGQPGPGATDPRPKTKR